MYIFNGIETLSLKVEACEKLAHELKSSLGDEDTSARLLDGLASCLVHVGAEVKRMEQTRERMSKRIAALEDTVKEMEEQTPYPQLTPRSQLDLPPSRASSRSRIEESPNSDVETQLYTLKREKRELQDDLKAMSLFRYENDRLLALQRESDGQQQALFEDLKDKIIGLQTENDELSQDAKRYKKECRRLHAKEKERAAKQREVEAAGEDAMSMAQKLAQHYESKCEELNKVITDMPSDDDERSKFQALLGYVQHMEALLLSELAAVEEPLADRVREFQECVQAELREFASDHYRLALESENRVPSADRVLTDGTETENAGSLDQNGLASEFLGFTKSTVKKPRKKYQGSGDASSSSLLLIPPDKVKKRREQQGSELDGCGSQ